MDRSVYMKTFVAVFLLVVSMFSFAKEKVCQYAGAFDSVRLKVDYDTVTENSDLYIQTIFQSENGNFFGTFESRKILSEKIDIGDANLGKFVDIENKTLYPFAKGAGRIKISSIVDELDYFPRLWNYPMSHSYLLDESVFKWEALSKNDINSNEYTETVLVITSTDRVDLKFRLYRLCDQ